MFIPDNKYYCIVTLLSKRGTNDLTSKLLSEELGIKNIGSGLMWSRNSVGIIYSVQIIVDPGHALAKEEEPLGKLRDLIKEKLDELDMKYFSCIIVRTAGAAWAGSNIELPDNLEDMVLIKKRKKVSRKKIK